MAITTFVTSIPWFCKQFLILDHYSPGVGSKVHKMDHKMCGSGFGFQFRDMAHQVSFSWVWIKAEFSA